MNTISYIDEEDIRNKRVLLRADFDVALDANNAIADDFRIRQRIPTLEYLLKMKNRIICVSKLGRPKQRDTSLSLKIVAHRLRRFLPGIKICLVRDFLTEKQAIFTNQQSNEILVLENIRFYPEEKQNDKAFAQKLADLAGAISLVGGGDTLSAISKKEYLTTITHVSTGGGAMLEFIEK